MPLTGRDVLVTGAGGFIGGHVCRRLVEAGATVHGGVRGALPAPAPGIAWMPLDVLDPAALERAIDELRPYAVIHLASRVTGSRDPSHVLPMFDTNLASTVHILNAALRVGARVVLAGTMEEPFPGEPLDTPPRSPYAASKIAAAGYARMFGRLWGLEAIVLRPSMVYGPAQADLGKLVPHTVVSLLKGEAPRLASGRRVSDWVDARDVADAFVAAIAVASPAVPTVDVGSGELHSVRHVVERLVALVGNGVEPVFGAIPDPPDEAGRPADLETAARVLGWRAAIDLERGLRDTVAWYAADPGRQGPG
jgi:nucleoside-diphosphate-sugar epimerase